MRGPAEQARRQVQNLDNREVISQSSAVRDHAILLSFNIAFSKKSILDHYNFHEDLL